MVAHTVRTNGVMVHGVGLDAQTRCAHYSSDEDIVAIKFYCCGMYYACHRCHEKQANHQRVVWPADAFDEPAVLCGACGVELRIRTYLSCGSVCPACGADFNPACRHHYPLYFAW